MMRFEQRSMYSAEQTDRKRFLALLLSLLKHRLSVFFLGVAAFLFPSGASAILVVPDSATASSFFASDPSDMRFSPTNTIDGSGLPASYDPSDSHADYSFSFSTGNHWTTDSGTLPTDGFISWSFSTPQTLDAIHIWNHRSNSPPASNSDYDVTLFDLTVFDAASGVILSLNDVSLAPDTSTGQTFLFGGVIAGVTSVRFDIEATQGTPDFTGLAEVAFNAVAVPEASTVLIWSLLTVGAGIGAIRRQRKEKSAARVVA